MLRIETNKNGAVLTDAEFNI